MLLQFLKGNLGQLKQLFKLYLTDKDVSLRDKAMQDLRPLWGSWVSPYEESVLFNELEESGGVLVESILHEDYQIVK